MAGQTDFSRISADMAKVEEARENRGSTKFEKVNWFKVPYGDTTFMVLPPFEDGQHIYKQVYIHHNFQDNEGRKRSYLCSREVHGSCPVCEKVERLLKAGQGDQAKQIKGAKTFLYNVLDIDLKNKVAGFKPSQHNEILQEINTLYSDSMVDITNPAKGRQIKLSRLKVTPWARARTFDTVKALSLSQDQINTALSGMKNLSKIYKDNTPQELTDMLAGKEVNQDVVDARKETEKNGEANTVATQQTTGAAEATTPPAAEVAQANGEANAGAATTSKRGRPAKTAEQVPEKAKATAAPVQADDTKATNNGEDDPELAAIMNMLD